MVGGDIKGGENLPPGVVIMGQDWDSVSWGQLQLSVDYHTQTYGKRYALCRCLVDNGKGSYTPSDVCIRDNFTNDCYNFKFASD